MRKLFYITASLILILSASSCSKQCIQCQATDHDGVIIAKSDVICDGPLNRRHFQDRFDTNYQGYNPVCSNVND